MSRIFSGRKVQLYNDWNHAQSPVQQQVNFADNYHWNYHPTAPFVFCSTELVGKRRCFSYACKSGNLQSDYTLKVLAGVGIILLG